MKIDFIRLNILCLYPLRLGLFNSLLVGIWAYLLLYWLDWTLNQIVLIGCNCYHKSLPPVLTWAYYFPGHVHLDFLALVLGAYLCCCLIESCIWTFLTHSHLSEVGPVQLLGTWWARISLKNLPALMAWGIGFAEDEYKSVYLVLAIASLTFIWQSQQVKTKDQLIRFKSANGHLWEHQGFLNLCLWSLLAYLIFSLGPRVSMFIQNPFEMIILFFYMPFGLVLWPIIRQLHVLKGISNIK